MLMHSDPASRISGQLVEVFAGQNEMYGGSSDTDTTDWQANPRGRSPSWAAITATPVQKCPITFLSVAASGAERASCSNTPRRSARPDATAVISALIAVPPDETGKHPD